MTHNLEYSFFSIKHGGITVTVKIEADSMIAINDTAATIRDIMDYAEYGAISRYLEVKGCDDLQEEIHNFLVDSYDIRKYLADLPTRT